MHIVGPVQLVIQLEVVDNSINVDIWMHQVECDARQLQFIVIAV